MLFADSDMGAGEAFVRIAIVVVMVWAAIKWRRSLKPIDDAIKNAPKKGALALLARLLKK